MIIKTNKLFTFVDNPTQFIRHKEMISATRIAQGKREFILALNHRQKFTSLDKMRMSAGKKKHEEFQTGISTIDEYGYIKFRRDLHKHKKITLQELNVISPKHAVYGIIDIVSLEFTKEGILNIEVKELKSGYSPRYIFQLMAYVMVLTDMNSKLVYGVPYKRPRKNKTEKREVGFLFPDAKKIKSININGCIHILYKKNNVIDEIVKDSQLVGKYEGLFIATWSRIRKYQEMLRSGAVDLSLLPHDKNNICCKRYPHICPKVDYKPNGYQSKFGKRKRVIK